MEGKPRKLKGLLHEGTRLNQTRPLGVCRGCSWDRRCWTYPALQD